MEIDRLNALKLIQIFDDIDKRQNVSKVEAVKFADGVNIPRDQFYPALDYASGSHWIHVWPGDCFCLQPDGYDQL